MGKETANHFQTMPFFTLTILYFVILLKLKLQKTLGERLMNTKIQRVKRQKKFLKMAIAFVLGFAVCWLPLNILGFFGKDLGSEQFVVLQSSLI